MIKLAIILDKIGDALLIGASLLLVLFPCWFIYKVFAGVYHLLDKLLDKL